MEIYLKISKLLLAHKTQNISAQETEELLAWRQEKTENEELFQKISQADGFEQFRQQSEEYDLQEKAKSLPNVDIITNTQTVEVLCCYPASLHICNMGNYPISESRNYPNRILIDCSR